MGKGAFTGVIHCFTGTQRLADASLALGLSISVSGIATFKNSSPLRDVIKSVPLDRLLVETDAPFLAPVPHRGKTNEPAFVVHTAAMLAGLKGSAPRNWRPSPPTISSACSAKQKAPMTLDVRILGCGSSGGVPRLGGSDGSGYWGACDPNNPKNRRTRCSVLVSSGRSRLLVDTSPDMREQLLAARVTDLDGVLITHDHADQLHGIDDLRVLTLLNRRRIDLWSDARGLAGIKAKFNYVFETPAGSDYPPVLNAHEIAEPFREFSIAGIPVLAFGVQHGRIRSLGFRFGGVAYTPDVDGLDEAAFAALAGIECWIVDALRHTRILPTPMSSGRWNGSPGSDRPGPSSPTCIPTWIMKR